jgi:hypothetical protein
MRVVKVTSTEDSSAHVVLSRTDVICLYNLLVASENLPFEAVGPRPFVRGLRDGFREVARAMGHEVEDA